MMQPRVHLHRRYRFSASHRLHVDALSAQANQTMFGKCNNPFGHGHNYIVQFTFSGTVDASTGMVSNLADIDAFAGRALDDLQCANLNTLPCFAERVPSTENLCVELWDRFQRFPDAKLSRVYVQETSNNGFEYAGTDAPSPVPPLPGGPTND